MSDPRGGPLPDPAPSRAAPWPPPPVPIPEPGSRGFPDFEQVLFSRRSVRRFKPDPVPEPVIRKLLEAGRWAPSSCNLQLWDFVVVTDAGLRERLAAETKFIRNSPLAIFLLYEKGHSEENWADVQSAACAGQNMQLMAYTQGLGAFWVLNLGNKDRLREILGVPPSKEIIAMLLFGYPAHGRAASRRRPLDEIVHWNGYRGGRELPVSQRPRDWTLEAIRDYQRRKVVSGIRYNKPLPWEQGPVLEAVRGAAGRLPREGARWLDVLPCTGVHTEALRGILPGASLTILELSEDVAEFVRGRVAGDTGFVAYEGGGRASLDEQGFDLVTCLFRLEGLPPGESLAVCRLAARAVRPGGTLVLAAVNRRSYHTLFQIARRWLGVRQVGFTLAPDPSVGPFEPVALPPVEAALRGEGLVREDERRLDPWPCRDELRFRARNRGAAARVAARVAGAALGLAAPLAGRLSPFARLVIQTWSRPRGGGESARQAAREAPSRESAPREARA